MVMMCEAEKGREEVERVRVKPHKNLESERYDRYDY
jgi:hypothetical protein